MTNNVYGEGVGYPKDLTFGPNHPPQEEAEDE